MPEETVHESESQHSRTEIASYFRRLARRFSRGEPVPVDEEQTVTVSPPPESELEVELEREGDKIALELEVKWTEAEGDVDTGADASRAVFELYEDNAEKWRWRLVHDNGNTIADSGEGYASAQKAEQGLESVRTNAPGAHIVDQSTDEDAPSEGGSSATFELFEDNAGQWRWRLVHVNGNIIGDGGQGYSSKQKAKQGLHSVKENVGGASIDELD